MSQIEKVNNFLEKAISESSSFDGIAIINYEGIILASHLPEDIPEDRMVSMALSVCRISQTTVEELNRGKFDQIFIKGDQGYIFVHELDENLILVVLIEQGALLGTMFSELNNLIHEINNV